MYHRDPTSFQDGGGTYSTPLTVQNNHYYQCREEKSGYTSSSYVTTPTFNVSDPIKCATPTVTLQTDSHNNPETYGAITVNYTSTNTMPGYYVVKYNGTQQVSEYKGSGGNGSYIFRSDRSSLYGKTLTLTYRPYDTDGYIDRIHIHLP